MAAQIPIQELPLKNIQLLRAVLRKLDIDPAARPQEYLMSLHAKHIADLAEEIVILESDNHSAASPIIARAIYESLFKLGLALKQPALSAEHTLREVEWGYIQGNIKGADQRKLEEIRKRPEYAPIGKSVSRLGQQWKLTPEQIASHEIHKTYWCAKEAGMLPLYQRQYAELSSYAHAAAPTFIARHLLRTVTTGWILVYVTLAIIEALTRIADKYRSSLPADLLRLVELSKRVFFNCDKAGYIKQFLSDGLQGIGLTKPASPKTKFQKN